MSSQSLKEICRSVFDGEVDPDSLQEWIEQFEPGERPYIVKLIGFFDYFSLRRTKKMLRRLHGLLCDTPEFSLAETAFIPIGYAAKSGGTISHLYRIENSVPEGVFCSSADFGKIADDAVKTLVFLDDYIGSGNQALNLWNHVRDAIPLLRLRNWKLVYAVVVARTASVKLIERETGFSVVASHLIDDSSSPLSAERAVFTPEELEITERILSKYGERLFPAHPLGYSRSRSLLGFFYSTPNNTLPVFWATRNNWRPLLPHGDAQREPAYLLAPLAASGIYGGDSAQKSFVEDDTDMSSLLISEFRTLRKARLVSSGLEALRVSYAVFSKILGTVRQLAAQEHEREPISFSLILVPDQFDPRRFPEYPVFASVVEEDADAEILESLAELSDPYNSGVLIKAGGKAVGLVGFAADTDAHVEFLPRRFRRLAAASRAMMGLGFFVSGRSQVDIFWNGQRVLLHRNANWYEPYSKQDIERYASIWAQKIQIRQKAVNYCLALAEEMIDQGVGGFLVIGDVDAVLDRYSDVRGHGLSVSDTEVFRYPMDVTMKLVSQDGATLIDCAARIRGFRVTIKLPPGIEVKSELRRGTKHETAAKLSRVSKCICFAISVDKNFSVYENGQLVIRSYG